MGGGSRQPTPAAKKFHKKIKMLKDPAAPKRPLSTFMLFCAEERSKYISENGASAVTEFAKEMGKRWNVLDREVKMLWDEKGKLAKTEYEEAMKDYNPSEEFLRRKADHDQKNFQVKAKTDKEQKIIQVQKKADLEQRNPQAKKKEDPEQKNLHVKKKADENQKNFQDQKNACRKPGLTQVPNESFSVPPGDVEDYFNFLAQNHCSTAASNPGVGVLQVQTLLWEKWGDCKAAKMKSSRIVKTETKPGNVAGNGMETAFSVFAQHMRMVVEQAMPDLNPEELTQAVEDKWEDMDDEKRARFKI